MYITICVHVCVLCGRVRVRARDQTYIPDHFVYNIIIAICKLCTMYAFVVCVYVQDKKKT